MTARANMKVVHVIGALIAGGAERFAAVLACQLAKQGMRASVWVLSTRADRVGRTTKSTLRASGVECVVGPTKKVGVRTVAWYTRQLWRENPDVVHLHTPNTEAMHFLATKLYVRSPRLYRTLHSTGLPQGALTLTAYASNKVICSVACSDAAAHAHAHIVPAARTITNGVEFSTRIKDSANTQGARAALGLDLHKFHFLHVGRMNGASLTSAPKAHDTLIAAWKSGGLGMRGAQLHLLGDGPLRSRLEALASPDPSISFHGVRDDVARWLIASDCFVMPSRIEGAPLAAIEAIGSGIPCIFSNIGPLLELNPPAATWAQVDDAQALAEKLREQLSHSQLPLERHIREFRARYSIESTALQYLRLYQGSLAVAPLQASASAHG